MSSFKKDCFFVCTNKEGCGACGSKRLVKDLKKLLKENDLSKQIKVVPCGCLGMCSEEIAAVFFPMNKTFKYLTKHDAPRIMKFFEQLKQSEKLKSTQNFQIFQHSEMSH